MSDWELSTFEKRFFRIVFLIFFIPAVSYIAYNKIFNNERDWSRYYQGIKEDSYNGIVVKKYVDYKDRAIEKIVLDNNKIFNVISTEWYEQFSIGDYVKKEKGSLIVYLIKQNNDTLKFDYRDIEMKDK